MRKPIEIYAFAVCFVTIIWFAISLTMLVNDLATLTFPQLMLVNDYDQAAIQAVPSNAQPVKANKDKVSEQAKKTAQTQEAVANAEKKKHEMSKLRVVRDLIHESISLIISGFLLVFHWRLGRSE